MKNDTTRNIAAAEGQMAYIENPSGGGAKPVHLRRWKTRKGFYAQIAWAGRYGVWQGTIFRAGGEVGPHADWLELKDYLCSLVPSDTTCGAVVGVSNFG